MQVGSKRATLDVLKAVNDYTQARIGTIGLALHQYPASANLLNPAEINEDYQIDSSGNCVAFTPQSGQSPRNASGFMKAEGGKTVYLTGISSSNQMLALSGVMFVRVAWYKQDKTFIGAAINRNKVELPDNTDIAWIRVCYSRGGSLATARYLCVLVADAEPLTVEDVPAYYPAGYDPADDVLRKKAKTAVPDSAALNTWGDSMIHNGSGENSSVGYYLSQLTGMTEYENGIPSQGSGEIALRMDAIEVHVTLENNRIVNGENRITAVWVNRGNAVLNLMQCNATKTYGVPCVIAGVAGTFWSYSGSQKFEPDEGPAEPVYVAPMTRVLVAGRRHYGYTLIWPGKNDMIAWRTSGLAVNMADMVSAMAEKIPHSRFVILGVTPSSTDDYKTGGGARTVMNYYNALMLKRFPDNFIDITRELLLRGLELAGITPTEDDETAMASGLLPPSLMADDGVHMNAACREVVAKIVHGYMQGKGWI